MGVDMNWWDVVIQILTVASFVGFAGAGIAYGVMAPWQKSQLGRWLIVMLSAVALSMLLIITLTVFPIVLDPVTRQTIRLMLYLVFATSGNGIFYSILHEQLKNRRLNRDAKVPHDKPSGQ